MANDDAKNEPNERLHGGKLMYPRCQRCGFTVEKGQLLCATCAEKDAQAAPIARIEVGAQPEPPYVRSGNFRRTPGTPEGE